jgi:hypothetical protein
MEPKANPAPTCLDGCAKKFFEDSALPFDISQRIK